MDNDKSLGTMISRQFCKILVAMIYDVLVLHRTYIAVLPSESVRDLRHISGVRGLIVYDWFQT